MVVKRGEYEYDLYMRVDTNTKGHHQWFYFSAENKSRVTRQITFNVVNFTKPASLYESMNNQGMKISVFNERDDDLVGCGWTKGGTEIAYRRSKINSQ